MYCEDSEGTDVDHLWPKGTYPGCAFVWENHLWACAACNSNHKRTRFPLDARGRPLLIDPTVDDPHEHLWLSPTTGAYSPITERGAASAEVYGLNRDALTKRREHAWTSLQCHVVLYDRFTSAGDDLDAQDVARTILREPHASVLVDLLRVAEMPNAHHFLRVSGVLDALARRPEIREWAADW